MQIESKLRKGAKTTLTIELGAKQVSRIRIVADSMEAREEAAAAVKLLFPAFEMIETLLVSSGSEASDGPTAQ